MMTLRHCALPLLLLLGSISLCSKANALEAIVPDSSSMLLDEIGLYRVGYQLRGQKEQWLPDGWTGFMEERNGVSCIAMGKQAGRSAFLLHCPWRHQTGVTFQEYLFRLPAHHPAYIEGAIAMREDAAGKSDGATFRIFANGKRLYDQNQISAEWRTFRLDLSDYAGKQLTLRFETDPGPQGNSSYDFSLWGSRTLVVPGLKPPPSAHPDRPKLNLARLTSVPAKNVVPASAFPGSNSFSYKNRTGIFRYQGEDGTLEYRWQPDQAGLYGGIQLTSSMRGDRPAITRLGGQADLQWTSDAQLTGTKLIPHRDSLEIQRTYQVEGESARVTIQGRIINKSLVFDVDCDQPLITIFEGGSWGPALRRKQITVPYYTGQIYYLPSQNLMVNCFLDWTVSSSTSIEGSYVRYETLTDRRRNRLRERVVFSAAWHLAEVFPGLPNAPSPYRSKLGERIVLDVWGGNYRDIEAELKRITSLGVHNSVVIVHDWQRSGYDNALPMHLPAASDKGGDPDMRSLVQAGVKQGFLMALHENYVDYYPNYDHFDVKDIALNYLGEKQLAWYNPGTKIQSFAIQPNAILPLAATQSPEIHQRFGTNADYLDVHSAVPPWFHVDLRGSEDGAGKFHQVWQAHTRLWEFERATHHGPVFGEGNTHWYWSGLLDGVEAQFGSGWVATDGINAPLAADFDLVRIHPLQLNHGMGYYERWWSNPTWNGNVPMAILDRYRLQEIAYGHMGFLASSTWRLLPAVWQEHHLVTPVSARYAGARPRTIRYHTNHGWIDGTRAAIENSWNQIETTYDNGLTVTANAAKTPLIVNGVTLPPDGWYAHGAGVTAWSGMIGSNYADYADTGNTFFVNARSREDWNLSGIQHIEPSVSSFEQTGPHTVRFAYRWKVDQTLNSDYHAFVHFHKADLPPEQTEAILFQQDHEPSHPTSEWKSGETVSDGPYTLTLPANLPDGDYAWKIGLFRPNSDRLLLEGRADGSGRISMGTLLVRDSGARIEFMPAAPTADSNDPYRRRLNAPGRVINFGAVQTDGSISIETKGDQTILRTFPAGRSFTLWLSRSRFPAPRRVQSPGGKQSNAVIKVLPDRWQLQLNGASEYRWKSASLKRAKSR